MNPKLVSLVAILSCWTGIIFSQIHDPTKFSQTGSTILCQNVRLQFLSPSLVRMEFSPSGNFLDAPTAVVLKRDWPQIRVKAEAKKGWLVAKTEKLTLRYLLNSGRFTSENLRIVWKDYRGEQSWAPGDSDKYNLDGIVYSLDGVRKNKLPKFHPGILSRSGYFIFDDSRTPPWNKDSAWIVPRAEKENQDWYCFVYGQDYAHVLKEYAELCGKIPMIPRYTLGAWITDLNYEYLPSSELVEKYRYSDEDIKSVVTRVRNEGIPIDILVLDFAWHRYGWKGGYDWSGIFPKPKEFLDWAHGMGLKISLNDHPGYGKESVLSDDDSHANEIRKLLDMPVPPKPKFSIDLSKEWKFQIDSVNSGIQQQWFANEIDDSNWKTLQAGTSWEEQGYPTYDGLAWYRKWAFVPKEAPRGSLYLIFGGVDDEYDLYVNGEKVAHHGSPNNSVYNSVTFTEVSPFVKRGEKNLIVLCVNDWGGGGGMTFAPVAIADQPPAEGIRFNLANKQHAEVFMSVLHNPLIDEGIDFWWVDGGRGSCEMEGLNSQMWTNRIFYDFTEKHTNKRSFIFSRYGGRGNHRYPAFFTGDTYSDWEVLAYEVPFTAMGGNVLMPYITHDIGGFLGKKIDFALYARWVQFGVFSPLVRLHCAYENPRDGNLRLPWIYGTEGINMVKKNFRLRYRLIPYIYTYCRIAHDEALPLVRPLYLEYPQLEKAYHSPGEYFFGKELLVAPITDSTNAKNIYLPPGEWIDYFSGKRYKGNQTVHLSYSHETFPLFVRAGSIIPQQPDMADSDQKALDTLIIEIYGPQSSVFKLYEDDGLSLDYRSGKYAWTPISFSKLRDEESQITIGPTQGEFNGQVEKRAYKLILHGLPQPKSIRVNDHLLPLMKNGSEGWSWDQKKSVITVVLEAMNIRNALKLVVK